jgi:tetratricopeptide (TPR) repeat protein
MNTAQLMDWLDHPEQLDKESLFSLSELVAAYPCFTAARMLLLKNLEKQGDLRFSLELPRTSLSVPDRKRLYAYMKGIKETSCQERVDSFSLIDHFLDQSGETQSEDLLALDGAAVVDWMLTENAEIEEKLLERQEKPANKEIEVISSSAGTAPSVSESIRLSDEVFPESSFTETLARIYIKQKRYDRALEIIKSLYLKYPEKNSYFADQIRFLEKLIANTSTQK